MRKGASFLVILALVVFLAGCATPFPAGALYTEIKLPAAVANGDMNYSKIGKSHCTSVLGLVATGDASIQTAAKNGGITRIKYVDYDAESFLGIVGTYTTTVYGD